MENELQVLQPPKTGKIIGVDRMVLDGFGNLLIWIGKALLKVDTYEMLESTIIEAEEKMDELEEKANKAGFQGFGNNKQLN